MPCSNFLFGVRKEVRAGEKDFFVLPCTAYPSEQVHCFTCIVQGERWV